MNRVSLIGRVTKDITVRRTQTGKAVIGFTIAVNKPFKNADGEYEADFINCVAFERRAEIISQYVKKGDRFCVMGRLSTRNYEKDGHKVYVTEVFVEDFEFLEGKKTSDPLDNLCGFDVYTEVEDDGDLPF